VYKEDGTQIFRLGKTSYTPFSMSHRRFLSE